MASAIWVCVCNYAPTRCAVELVGISSFILVSSNLEGLFVGIRIGEGIPTCIGTDKAN